MDIFSRLKSGEPIPMNDPKYDQIHQAAKRTIHLTAQLNASGDIDQIRKILSEIVGYPLDESVTVFPPFHINYRGATQIGKNVFINHACVFLGLGGIVIEDEVLIGPRVNLTSENHPVGSTERKALIGKTIVIKRQCMDWCWGNHTYGCYYWRKLSGSGRSSRIQRCTSKLGGGWRSCKIPESR